MPAIEDLHKQTLNEFPLNLTATSSNSATVRSSLVYWRSVDYPSNAGRPSLIQIIKAAIG